MRFLLLCLFLTLPSLAFADDWIEQGVRQRLGRNSNMSERQTTHLVAVLKNLSKLQGSGSSALHQRFFGPGPVNGEAYVRWIFARVTYFAYDSTGLFLSNETTLAYAVNLGSLGRVVTLKPKFFEEDLFVQVSCLLHESQHLAPDSRHSHVDCEAGKVSLDCDSTIDGPYAVSVIALANIAHFGTDLEQPTVRLLRFHVLLIMENRLQGVGAREFRDELARLGELEPIEALFYEYESSIFPFP